MYMKTVIIIFVVAFIMFFVAGCGPGQPFEIEGRQALQSSTPEFAAAE
jgi:Na+/H+ antiporter NhaC